MKGTMKEKALVEDCGAQRSTVVVLGADGLAAPAVARLLACLGCDAPASERDGASKIAAFNEEALRSSGTLINHWAAFNNRWLRSPKATQFLKRALVLLQSEFGESYLSVIQDGSTARLLPFWNKVLDRAGILPRYLLVISDPQEAAQNLYERLGIEHRTGHLVWLRSVLDAEANSRNRLRAFVRGAQLSRNPIRTTNSLAETLTLSFPRDVQTAFASKDLRLKEFRGLLRQSERVRSSGNHSPVTADWVAAAYQILTSWASEGETIEGRTILDAIREAFDEAAPVFLGVDPDTASKDSRIRELEQELESLRDAACAEANELRRLGAEAAQALVNAQEELRNANAKAAQDLAEAQADVRARYVEIVSLTRMLATETAAARRFEHNAKRLGAIAQTFERSPTGARKWFDWIVPWRRRVQQIKRTIQRDGVFDSNAYLEANPDVKGAGVDPLRHYLVHGASEGRPLGIESL